MLTWGSGEVCLGIFGRNRCECEKARRDAAGFLFPPWAECCAVDRLQLYLEDSLRKNNWCYRLKMPLEECAQRAPRLRAGYPYSAPVIGSWPR